MGWYAELGPVVPVALIMAVIGLLGLLRAALGRRVGCPPVTRDRVFASESTEEIYRRALAAIEARGLLPDVTEPGIRILAREAHGHAYRRLPKEIEVRIFEEQEGSRMQVTVRYLAVIPVDTGESAYAGSVAAEIAGVPVADPRPAGRPFTVACAEAATVVSIGIAAWFWITRPTEALGLIPPEVLVPSLSAAMLSASAFAQILAGKGLLGGRRNAILCLAISLGLVAVWTTAIVLSPLIVDAF